MVDWLVGWLVWYMAGPFRRTIVQYDAAQRSQTSEQN